MKTEIIIRLLISVLVSLCLFIFNFLYIPPSPLPEYHCGLAVTIKPYTTKIKIKLFT